MSAALWIIAICGIIRAAQNFLQIAITERDAASRGNVYSEIVRQLLEEYERRKGGEKLTGAELIAYIQNNHLEDYTFVVSHETGEGAYPITETTENHNEGTVELY